MHGRGKRHAHFMLDLFLNSRGYYQGAQQLQLGVWVSGLGIESGVALFLMPDSGQQRMFCVGGAMAVGRRKC
jgi:hypothetical protein